MKFAAKLILSIMIIALGISCAPAPAWAGETTLPTIKVAMSDDQSIIIERMLYEGLLRSGYQMVAEVA